GAVVPVDEGARAADPRPASRGGADRPGGADAGARAGRARHPPGAVSRRGPAAVPPGACTRLSAPGDPPAQGHEKGPIEEEAPPTPGRVGTPLSGPFLAFTAVVDNNRWERSIGPARDVYPFRRRLRWPSPSTAEARI